MVMEFVTDATVLHVATELSTLEEHLGLIEGQIERSNKAAESELEAKILELSPDSSPYDEEEWIFLHQEHNYRTQVVFPRILRGPFLVTLFAVYESVVIEIAGIIQKRQGQQISLNDIKGDFLSRAQKYYMHVLQFELSTSGKSWQRLMLLSNLRNAIAHANGRLGRVKEKLRNQILKQKGVKDEFGYLIISGAFLGETFTLVKEDLEDLLTRYKEWDKANRS